MEEKRQKHAVVAEYLAGGTSTRKLGIKYGYGCSTVSRWVIAEKKAMGKRVRLAISETLKGKDDTMPSDVNSLQQELRLLRLKVDLLETMIDISDEQYGTDIRKKAGTRPS